MRRAGSLILVILAMSCAHARSGADQQLVSGVRTIVDESVAAGTFSGVVLVAGERDTLFEGAYGLADRSTNRLNGLSTCFDIASLGKMFTGVAVGQLAERHQLDFDAPVGRYLPPALADT